jgi:hypothetical protein
MIEEAEKKLEEFINDKVIIDIKFQFTLTAVIFLVIYEE